MKLKTLFGAAALLVLAANFSFGASLPTGLSGPEIDEIVQDIGQRGAMKLLRPAEALALWPGIKLGVELNLMPTGGVGASGNQDGNVPGIIFMPRLYLAKGLSSGVEAIFSYAPAGIASTVGSMGLMFKYNFYDEKEKSHWASVSGYGGYTSITAFDNTYSGGDIEFGAVATKSYANFRPFLGVGLLFARGTVSDFLAKSKDTTASTQATFHSFLGTEFHFPLDVTMQLDLMNLSVMGSVFVGKSF